MEWSAINGKWKIEQTILIQEEVKNIPYGISIKDKFSSDSYVFKGKVTLLKRDTFLFRNNLTNETFKLPHGEAKFFYNKAHDIVNNALKEDYRIDLICQDVRGICRLTIAGAYVAEVPINFKENSSIDFMMELKTIKLQAGKSTLLSFYFNEHLIFNQIPIYEDFDGYIGVGTFNSNVKFENLQLSEFAKKKCFMIMQYDNRRKYLFNEIVNPVIKEIETDTNYKFDDVILLENCVDTGSIYEQMAKLLINADILIADISTFNLNVFFELGFAAGLNKKIILLREKESKIEICSDLRDRRYIEYKLPILQHDLDNEIARLRQVIKKIILNELIPQSE